MAKITIQGALNRVHSDMEAAKNAGITETRARTVSTLNVLESVDKPADLPVANGLGAGTFLCRVREPQEVYLLTNTIDSAGAVTYGAWSKHDGYDDLVSKKELDAIDSGVVHLGKFVDTHNDEVPEEVTGIKKFVAEPFLGNSKSSSAIDDGTKFATEAQVYKKVDKAVVKTPDGGAMTGDVADAAATWGLLSARVEKVDVVDPFGSTTPTTGQSADALAIKTKIGSIVGDIGNLFLKSDVVDPASNAGPGQAAGAKKTFEMIREAKLASQRWIESVNNYNELPQQIDVSNGAYSAYLCRVVNSVPGHDSGIYQYIVDPLTSTGSWSIYHTGSEDFLDHQDLAEAISDHDGDAASHPGIVTSLGSVTSRVTSLEGQAAAVRDVEISAAGTDKLKVERTKKGFQPASVAETWNTNVDAKNGVTLSLSGSGQNKTVTVGLNEADVRSLVVKNVGSNGSYLGKLNVTEDSAANSATVLFDEANFADTTVTPKTVSFLSSDKSLTLDVESNPTNTHKINFVVSNDYDDKVVHKAGNETISGTKTFSSEPVLGTGKSSAASESDTKLATEKQVFDVGKASVKNTGDETIAGVKTFSSEPVLGAGKSTAVSNIDTVFATEKQVLDVKDAAVQKTGNETIAGVKTFSNEPLLGTGKTAPVTSSATTFSTEKQVLDVKEGSVQKTVVPLSGNGRNQLLSAVELTHVGGKVDSFVQYSVDVNTGTFLKEPVTIEVQDGIELELGIDTNNNNRPKVTLKSSLLEQLQDAITTAAGSTKQLVVTNGKIDVQ